MSQTGEGSIQITGRYPRRGNLYSDLAGEVSHHERGREVMEQVNDGRGIRPDELIPRPSRKRAPPAVSDLRYALSQDSINAMIGNTIFL